MTTTDKSRENRLRRWAKRLGLELQRSRKRHFHIGDQGHYALIHPDNKALVFGHSHDLTLDDVETTLATYERKLVAERRA